MVSAQKMRDVKRRDVCITFLHNSRSRSCSVAALSGLSTVLTTGGGYLPLACRSLIDSIVLTCLASIGVKAKSRVATWSFVKVEILQLGSACLCSPWPDGAMSAIASDLQKTARLCTQDRERSVVAEATACLRLCDSLSMPRVSALSIITSRELGREASSAVSLVAKLKSAQEDIVATEVTAAKSARPLEDGPKKVEKMAKRQKLKADDVKASPNVPKLASEPVVDPPPSKAFCENDKGYSEAACATKTQLEGMTAKSSPVASSLKDSGVASGTALEEQQRHDKTADKTKITQEPEGNVSQEPMRALPASLKNDTGDDSEDDGFFPNIVVDGGPDEEDQ